MAKKLYAVTNIKLSSDKSYKAGEEIDPSEIKDALGNDMDKVKELFDAGALEVRETEDTKEASEEEAPVTTEEPKPTENPETPETTENPEAPVSPNPSETPNVHGDQPKVNR
jgi:hypothetical protein